MKPKIKTKVDMSASKATMSCPKKIENGAAIVGLNTASDKNLRRDLIKLTNTQLRRKYHREYSSWKNRKHYCNKNGGTFHPSFQDFRDFLWLVGRCPGDGYTLDRIDYSNPDYGPGLVRWADKTLQANNRSNTKHLDIDGQTKPLSDWAKEADIPLATVRKRLQRNWPPAEAVFGRDKGAYNNSDTCADNWACLFNIPSSKRKVMLERLYKKTRLKYETRAQWAFSLACQQCYVISQAAPPEPFYAPYYSDMYDFWSTVRQKSQQICGLSLSSPTVTNSIGEPRRRFRLFVPHELKHLDPN